MSCISTDIKTNVFLCVLLSHFIFYVFSVQAVKIICNAATAFDVLRKLFKNEARFKSVGQREMVRAAIDAIKKVTDILIVLPTGAGKSVGFAAAAMFEREGLCRKTIVICPLTALCADLKVRLVDMGLCAEVIDDSASIADTAAEILIMTPERGNTAVVFQGLQALDRKGLLGSIWWDESQTHLAYELIRPVMLTFVRRSAEFKNSSRLFLSATLPPRLVKVWRVKAELANLRVIRYETSRPEIHYLKKEVEDREMLPQTLGLVAKVIASNFYIVYTRMITSVASHLVAYTCFSLFV